MAHGRSRFFESVGAFCVRHRWWIIGFWFAVIVGLNLAVPQIEKTVSERSAAFLPDDMPSVNALRDMSTDFGSPASTAVGNVVLAADRGIDDADGRYYAQLVSRLTADRDNVAYVLDMYGNPATRDAARSPDGKAVTVMVAAQGDVGSTRAHHSTVEIRSAIDSIPKPDGLSVYYTGASPTLADLFSSIDVSLLIITVVSVVLITLMLLIAYRSIISALIPLLTIGIGLGVVRPIISALGAHEVLSISNFTIAIMTALILGAGTDYAIFQIAGYHDARRAGADPDTAVAIASAKVSPILLASALTIAAAAGAMAFTKVGMFKTAGPPTAIGVLVVMVISATLTPALMSVAGRAGRLQPKVSTERRWRRRGVTIIRHAGPLTAVSMVVLILLALVIPTFRVSFNEESVQLYANDSTRGYDAVLKHYGVNEILPEYLIVRADHDMRNTNDLAALEMMAMSVSKLPDIAYVRSITRPDGKPIPEASTGFQVGQVGNRLDDAHRQLVAASPQLQQLASGVTALRDGADDAAAQLPRLVDGTDQVVGLADGVLDAVDTATRIVTTASNGRLTLPQGIGELSSLARVLGSLVDAVSTSNGRTLAVAGRLDDVFGPMLTAAPDARCLADPACMTARAAFGVLDRATAGAASRSLRQVVGLAGVPGDVVATARALLPDIRTGLAQMRGLLDGLGGRTPEQLRADLGRLTSGMAQLSTGMSQLATGLRQVKDGTDKTVSLTGQLTAGLGTASGYLTTMADATTSGPGSGFYLPAQALGDPRFVAGTKLLLSPTGKTARMLVIRSINPYSDAAMRSVGDIATTAKTATAGTVLEGANVSSTGLTSLSADMNKQVNRDFALYAIVAITAVFLILSVLLRSLLAPLLLVLAVLLSFAATVGLAILFWQHGLGIDLDWSVIPLAFMALVAVGADYSMLFASRIREHSATGMVGGIIRGFGTTGGVITTAGIVFAVTMFALMSATVINLLQFGFTVGVGLILDVVIVRSILVPAAMALIGNRIWWPAKV
ncbi:MMPL family transporter [Williamsia phyllosphaerae]|uniref:Membrane protein, MmpL family n=1 Tax=Williamsia phyllosphaerae TaxID=885042 RepID=A0ABQ1V2P1_9NOCA|nr:MMPL family transporter [Williamsia phyllosphaerae]GGF36100.1 putative membrane protein, MmpL family [Williamsia phyllosphaerae]